MARTASTAQQLRLQGPPRRLRVTGAAVPKGGTGTLVLTASAKSGQAVSVPAHVVQRREEASQLRARLPRDTPPGTYAARLEIEGAMHPVEITVEPQERLSARPAQSDFDGEPGGTAEITLTLFNRGNVAINIPETIVIGIYDNDGLEEAFASTYRQETDDALKLIGHWVAKLREGYGGLLKCSVVAGAGALAPGEQHALTIKTTLPSKLKPGHSYHGALEIGPLTHSIGVNVHKRERGGQK